eukprot:GFUD01032412.1.p1 GENE.GFUD01032412.1~~GFUD01032412.1.p1  ORF type:complete len:1599 (+),score=470.99 GFUD01032412.1:1027-5823(+)
MANKSLSKKEEFFQVLNLVATKKVKVRYCRTIKERLRPSTIEESLALPIKPKSPVKRKTEETRVDGDLFLTPENQAENLQLRGGVSLLKSYKNKKKIKMKTASLSTPPCTKSLLSYLQHKAKDSDSSSVESDCEFSTDNGNEAESVRDDFKLKQMSVSMTRLSPDKLDRISSRTASLDSGGNDLKMKGFSDDSVNSTKKNNKILRDLIDNLETEIDDDGDDDKKDRDKCLSLVSNQSFENNTSEHDLESVESKVTNLDLSNDNLEVVEDRDVVMQMVEDFSLMSESDSEEEDRCDSNKICVKTEPVEPTEEKNKESKAMVWFPEGENQYPVKKESLETDLIVRKHCFPDPETESEISLTSISCQGRMVLDDESSDDQTSTNSESTEETLEEMLHRLEKSQQKRNGELPSKKVAFPPTYDDAGDSDSLDSSLNWEDTSPLAEFDNPALATLVSRMRRESRIEKRKQNKFLLEGSGKCRILQKCEYWIKEEQSAPLKPYDCIILSEPKIGFSRLNRPTKEDRVMARKVLKIEGFDFKCEDQDDDDEVTEQLEIEKPIEMVQKKKVKKKRPLEGGKRRKRVNGIDEYIRNIMENRDKVLEPPATEPVIGLLSTDSSTDLVTNSICNDVDVSSEINSTSISRDTLDISLHAETETDLTDPELEDDLLLGDPTETFSFITTLPDGTQKAMDSQLSNINIEHCTNQWEEGVCILEKVESPRKSYMQFKVSGFPSIEDTIEPDEFEPKDEDFDNSYGLKKFQCNKCGKEFGTKNGLDYHERTHSGLSPFECDVCFKRFKSSSLCSRHKQIHSVTKKYNCDVCLKSFAQKSNLSKHMDIHAGIKPYQCPTCPKAFTQKVHLECHIMTHTKDKPWKCLSCATRFSKKSSLIRHSQNVHDMGKDDHEKFILLEEFKFEKEDEEEDDDEKKLMARVRQMRREKKRRKEKFETAYGKTDTSDLEIQQLNVIPIAVGADETSIEVANTVLGNLVQNDLNEVNEQFDVEVTYCEDIDILDVPNDTLFIMDSSFDAKATEEDANSKQVSLSPVVKAKFADLEQDSEQIEDIQKFLEESKSGTEADLAFPELNMVKTEATHSLGGEDDVSIKKVCDVPEPSGDKKPKYRIPKSPKKGLKLSSMDRKTPHIPYKKESGLKIISLSENFSRNKVKNEFKSSKKHSFEQALNEALTMPSKKVDRFLDRRNFSQSRIVQKPANQSSLSRRLSQSNDHVPKSKQVTVKSPEKRDTNTIVLSKPKIPFKSDFVSPKPDVIKRMLGQQPLTLQNSLDKKPVIKPLFKPVIKSNSLDPKRIKLDTKLETLPSSFSTSQLKYLSQSLKPVPAAVQPAKTESTDQKASVSSSQDLYNSLKADLFNNSSGLDLYSSAAVRGLPVPVPAASELQSTLTTISAYLTTTSTSSLPLPTQAVVEPIKRSESQGYYTSNRATGLPDSSKSNWVKLETSRGNHELTDIESTDVESEEDNPAATKGQQPTFLPTNFPTFDSPGSSPRNQSGLSTASSLSYGSSFGSFSSSYNPQTLGVSSIKHSGIKPTAVVSPSRPRMPVLPKPVPAAFAASPVRVEKVSVVTTFMCSVCGAEFSSRASLVTHEQATHWRS